MKHILIATSNQGKLRDFAGAAKTHGVEVLPVPGFSSLPAAVEDGFTFEQNARKKAEFYSRFVPGELVLADDSGISDQRWRLFGRSRQSRHQCQLAGSGCVDDRLCACIVRKCCVWE